MKKIKITLLSLALMVGLVALPFGTATVSAQPATTAQPQSQSAQSGQAVNPSQQIGEGVKAVGGGAGQGQGDFTKAVQTVVNTLLFILGLVAVIMIILGGFRYVTSNGDPGATKTAKDTIMYAVIGLVVAILAFAIVSFVVTTFAPKS